MVPIVALVAIVGGCSSGEADPRVGDALTQIDGSPLFALFGVDPGREQQRMLEVEQHTADCMAEHGFDYRPAPLPAQSADSAAALSGATPTLEVVEQHGYGIADDLEAQLAFVVDGLNQFATNPNAAVLESLTPDEFVDYRRAMTGISPDEAVFDDDGVPVNPTTRSPLTADELRAAMADGCASSGVAAGDPGRIDLLGSDLYFEAQALVLADPRVIALQMGWRTCMAAAGHPYGSQQEIIGMLYEAVDDIVHAATEGHHEGDDAALIARVDDLRAREVAVALVDLRCSADLFEQGPQIAFEIERQFIRDNEARLVDLLDQSR